MTTLKGKLVCKTPAQRTDETIAIPKELKGAHSEVHMFIDVMWVNNVRFLTTIGYPIYYRKTVHLENEEAKTLYPGLDNVLRAYNSGGYRVENITCDNGFKKVFEDVSNNLDVNMEYTNPHAHEPHTERNNRTIKNQVRTGLHRTTYKFVPRIMIKHLVISSTEEFNMFPARNGVNDYYSPETLVTDKLFNYDQHCKFRYGDYVQADDYNDPRNDMRPRCIDGIYLRPAENTRHYVMDLQTRRDVIQGGPITVIP